MAWLIDQILALLASDAGNLTYHLVLAFSIAGALQISIQQSTRLASALNRRALFGLLLLLVFQISLFVASGLVWQGVVDGRAWLPLLDRSVTLLSLVVIIWLWSFPRPDPAADAASLILGMLVVIGSVFGVLGWMGRTPGVQTSLSGLVLNGSSPDLWMQYASLAVIGLGELILALTRPSGWGYGLSMLLLLAGGHISHLLLLPYGGDYPTALRLFQMAAYPFLIILPQRLIFEEGVAIPDYPREVGAENVAPAAGAARVSDLNLLKSLLGMVDNLGGNQACRRIASILANATHAGRVFLVTPPDSEGKLRILCGFDKNTRRYAEGASVEASSLPILTSCLKTGRVRRLAATSASPDRINIARIYGFDQVGTMLFVPVLSPQGSPLAGAILLADDPQNDWAPDEQSAIGLLAKLLVHFMRRGQETQAMQTDLEQARLAARRVQDQVQQVLEEEQKLRDKIAVLQESARRDQEQILEMSALIADQLTIQRQVSTLEEENKLLNERILREREEAADRREPLEGELRLALEEISLLRATVEESEKRLAETQFAPDQGQASDARLANIVSIAQDLRQPLSSIIDYLDLLLGESVGILGANQRKYLERIKLSTERFGRLVGDLMQASTVESDPSRIQPQEIDVRSVIQDALRETNGLIQLRRVVVNTRLPNDPLKIQTDQNALRKVIAQLLRNAGAATPEGGEVGVVAWLETSESEKDYVFVQISDKGGGIPLRDLPWVFTPRPDGLQLKGIGDGGVDFARVKTLVEVLGGRTWVDSELGAGSVFSLVLPVIQHSVGEELA